MEVRKYMSISYYFRNSKNKWKKRVKEVLFLGYRRLKYLHRQRRGWSMEQGFKKAGIREQAEGSAMGKRKVTSTQRKVGALRKMKDPILLLYPCCQRATCEPTSRFCGKLLGGEILPFPLHGQTGPSVQMPGRQSTQVSSAPSNWPLCASLWWEWLWSIQRLLTP